MSDDIKTNAHEASAEIGVFDEYTSKIAEKEDELNVLTAELVALLEEAVEHIGEDHECYYYSYDDACRRYLAIAAAAYKHTCFLNAHGPHRIVNWLWKLEHADDEACRIIKVEQTYTQELEDSRRMLMADLADMKSVDQAELRQKLKWINAELSKVNKEEYDAARVSQYAKALGRIKGDLNERRDLRRSGDAYGDAVRQMSARYFTNIASRKR